MIFRLRIMVARLIEAWWGLSPPQRPAGLDGLDVLSEFQLNHRILKMCGKVDVPISFGLMSILQPFGIIACVEPFIVLQ